MGCSRSQAPMRLFLCIFDKDLGREGLSQQVTPEQSQKLEPARSRAETGLIRGVIRKSLNLVI